MGKPVLLLTGFEPFLDVEVNASGQLARALDRVQLAGVELRSFVLPVSFRETPLAYEAAVESLQGEEIVAFCSLGVQREDYFRLESRARRVLTSDKPDNLGAYARDFGPLGDQDLRSSADLDGLVRALRGAGGKDVRISEDAGGYLCERCYWEALRESSARDRLGVFLHVPPLEFRTLEQQLPPLRAFIAELVAQGQSASS